MKRIYKKPLTSMIEVPTAGPLAASGVSSDQGIGYGGVDEGGKLDPAARRKHRSVWSEEED